MLACYQRSTTNSLGTKCTCPAYVIQWTVVNVSTMQVVNKHSDAKSEKVGIDAKKTLLSALDGINEKSRRTAWYVMHDH